MAISPFLVASVLSLLSWLTLPGYYCPDATAFIQQTVAFGDPQEWHPTAPVYPMLLNLVGSVFPPDVRMPLLVALQLIAAVVLPTLSFLWIGRLLKKYREGWWAAWATGLYGPSYLLAHTLQTEASFVGLCALALLLAILALKSGSWGGVVGLAVASGVVSGVAIGNRAVGFVLLAALAASLLWFGFRDLGWKRAIIGALALIIGGLATVSSFKMRNERVFGDGEMASGTGIHLWNRICASNSPKDGRFAELVQIAKEEGAENPDADNSGWNCIDGLMRSGLDKREADLKMKEASVEALLKSPAITAMDTFGLMAKSTRWNHPFNKYGTIFMTDGIRPEHFDKHIETCEFWWQNSLHLVENGVETIPPYPARGWMGAWAYYLFEGLAYLGCLWSGWWVIVVGMVGFCFGVLRKNLLTTVGFGIAMGMLGASAFGEAPQIRFWAICVPFFLLGLAGAIGSIRERRN